MSWCLKGCCKFFHLDRSKYCEPDRVFTKTKTRKAGCLVINASRKSILLVQSNYRRWGPPKGSVEDGESDAEAAARELYEEAGVSAKPKDLIPLKSRKYDAFFVLYLDNEAGGLLNRSKTVYNDSTGLVWLKIACALSMIRHGELSVNSSMRMLLKTYFRIQI